MIGGGIQEALLPASDVSVPSGAPCPGLLRGILFWSMMALLVPTGVYGQHTVGLTQYSSAVGDGYVLFAPLSSTVTFLIDRCGRKVNAWNSGYPPGVAAELEPDGSLLRTAAVPNAEFFVGGGRGGRLERFDWGGDPIWSCTISSDSLCLHHDFTVLPNGNIVAIAWERHDSADAVLHGKVPDQAPHAIWSERLIELQPVGADSANVVWQWSLWDHLVQHVDPALPSFGLPSDHPELVDINQGPLPPQNVDWVHMNSVSYNAGLDQIMVSVHNLNEIWIIDHGTTTAEAAGHTGGMRGHGGDLLFRWGNPRMYGRGTIADQRLFGQHHATWIRSGFPYAGNILVFNNGAGRPEGDYSSIDIITPPVDPQGNYALQPGNAFGPDAAIESITAPVPTDLFSSFIGGVFPTENGYLVTNGPPGEFLQFDTDDSIIWRYRNPVNASGPMTQGDPPLNNSVFRAVYYPAGFSGFVGHDMTPGQELELMPTTSLCSTQAIAKTEAGVLQGHPNPTSGAFHVSMPLVFSGPVHVTLVDMEGTRVLEKEENAQEFDLDLSMVANGMYILQLEDGQGHSARGQVVRME
jgi:hypothetical protein